MAEYLQTALEKHPRTRRFGELIADVAYPITSSIAGSSYVPFHATILNGVNSLKQTSDYIFQPPYERLLNQFEESIRLKQSLEHELQSTQSEFEILKVSSCPVCKETEESRESSLKLQKEKYDQQTHDLHERIAALSNRVDVLVISLAQKEYENEEMRRELDVKERALSEALLALEEAKAQQMPIRPTIETKRESGVGIGILTPDSARGLSTPESMKGRELSKSPSGDFKVKQPEEVALPEEDGSLLEQTMEEDVKPVEEHAPIMEESAVLVNYPVEDEKEPEVIPAETEAAPAPTDTETAVPEPPVTVAAVEPQVEVPASRSPSPSSSTPLKRAKTPVISLNDERPISGYVVGVDNQIHPISLSKYERGNPDEGNHNHTSTHSRTQSSSAIHSSPSRPRPKGHGSGNVAFSSFGFGSPLPKQAKSPKAPASPESIRKKKHSFFGKHSSHSDSISATNGDSNNKKQSDDESSLNSSHSHSKELSSSRPNSPSGSGKLARHPSHSFFRDHVKTPLERTASQIAHKVFKHESSEHLSIEYSHSQSQSQSHSHGRKSSSS